MKIERFEDIEAWKLAREITIVIYRATDDDGFNRDFGLRDQIRRAAGSIMHNIAEGFDAGSNAEFIRFLNYAKRSCTEVQSELYVALDRRYLTQQQFNTMYDQARLTRAKIGAFIKYLSQYDSGQKTTQGPRQPRAMNSEL
jgi:four helix bundle protein